MEDNDIKIDNGTGNFKFRVNGILMHDNEVLVVKMQNNPFYCLPGGHVKLGEDTQNAVIREIKEETGYNSHINKLITTTENFFERKNGKKIHELGFYYLLNLDDKENVNAKEYEAVEENEDKVELHFKWIPIDKLESVDFRPQELKEKLQKNNIDFQHLIIK
ncbi:MAG: NUDIX domain-containing protein [Clostridia bacterium]|jgi:ADP-ribose pyrophosphatase YjhB (NUDIX family)|nr:NUDIX domain-containing protein [Clostridia bacterium]